MALPHQKTPYPFADEKINPKPSNSSRTAIWTLFLGSLGVVYGDIGTSPLYSLRECFDSSHGVPLTHENIFGILSLIFWSLTLVVAIKYLGFILKADNRGEGGIMALIAILLPASKQISTPKTLSFIILFGIFGAALLYGDGIITPAISVLSAVEGLAIATPTFKPAVIPITVAVLFGLFSVQSRGTAKVGSIFGPAMLVWFATITLIGIPWIYSHPEILKALNPTYCVEFFARNGFTGIFVLSAVVLCITGAEALYADMGHFGKAPIRLGWFSIVFPALIVNYFGQGALLLEKGSSVLENPFYSLAPSWSLYPLVILATIATVIASQALISGAYSLTQQAIQLGYFPRTQVLHTSNETEGQIFISRVNQFLMIGSITLVILFRHSSSLAGAYGVAVTATMLITSILYFSVAKRNWRWRLYVLVPVVFIFLSVDAAFFFSNLTKIFQGGWIPILLATAIFTVMLTWKTGRESLAKVTLSISMPLNQFMSYLTRKKLQRVSGTAVFMTVTENIAPPVLLHHIKHNQVLHERVILLTIATRHQPQIEPENRIEITEYQHNIYRVKAQYGYMETPDISEILIFCLGEGLPLNINELSFYLGRETFILTGTSGMRYWRKKLFVFLSRNARPATDFFGLPADQVVELGSQVAI